MLRALSDKMKMLLHHGRVVGRDVGGLRAHLAGRSCFSGGSLPVGWGRGAELAFWLGGGGSESVGGLIALLRGGGYVVAGNA